MDRSTTPCCAVCTVVQALPRPESHADHPLAQGLALAGAFATGSFALVAALLGSIFFPGTGDPFPRS